MNHCRRSVQIARRPYHYGCSTPRKKSHEFVGTRQWRAVDPTCIIAREYSVRATIDLFGRIIVEQRWVRIGFKGCGNTTSFENGEVAEGYIERVEVRRATSPRRLKVSYIEVGRP